MFTRGKIARLIRNQLWTEAVSDLFLYFFGFFLFFGQSSTMLASLRAIFSEAGLNEWWGRKATLIVPVSATLRDR
jgi:hypothetical protein